MSNNPQLQNWLEQMVNIESIKKDFISGEDIPAGAAVCMHTDGAIYKYTTAKQDQYVGVAHENIPKRCECTVTLTGYLKVKGSGWQAGVVYYVQNGGGLVPGTGDAKIAVGVGRDAVIVFNNLSEIDYFILTTLGNSGPATLTSGNLLNIPNYTLSGLGGVPLTRQLTINGTTQDLSADRTWSVGTVTSVGLTMPNAFTVSNSPITTSGNIQVVGAGTAVEYIRGDGELAPITAITGGGTTVSYYLNGSVNQGVFGGNTYYEMNRTPVIGPGTDFTRATDGLIAEFITDPLDPSVIAIPSGAWRLNFFFSASTNLGSPSFYAELYSYDGAVFTLIATNSGSPEGITNGTTIDLYNTFLSVPSTLLGIADRLALRVYVNVSGNTLTFHTEDSHLAEVETTFATGITSLNGLNDQVQFLGTGTAGTDFNIVSLTGLHTFNLPVASALNTGKLSNTDWSNFDSKVPGSRNLTINSVTYDLTADRTWTINAGGLEQYATLAAFPLVGDPAISYLAQDTNSLYYWDGAVYVQMGGSSSEKRYASSGVYGYCGTAITGTLTSSPTWDITRLTYSSDGSVTATACASGVAWDNYLIVVYGPC